MILMKKGEKTMAVWNPWHGCHRYSEGCKFCYIHKGDFRRGVDTNNIYKTEQFYAPIAKNKKGEYKIKSGQLVYLCFTSDFFIEEADEWREECWKMIKERSDVHFLFLTKRILRFMECIPSDWGAGYENVTVSCTVENQKNADERLSYFQTLPIVHKNIVIQPMIEAINLSNYLNQINCVIVGGESDKHARPLNYDWVLSIRRQCMDHKVHFTFRQCGSNFIKDGRQYHLQVKDLCSQARKAGIDL